MINLSKSSVSLNSNITIASRNLKRHLKASEKYVHVNFHYPNSVWDGWVPVEYRRTGTFLENNEEIVTLRHCVSMLRGMEL
jgi:hypothetical protein